MLQAPIPGRLYVLDTGRGEELVDAIAHQDGTSAIAWLSPQEKLLTASFDGVVSRWDSASGAVEATTTMFQTPIFDMVPAAAPDEIAIVTLGTGKTYTVGVIDSQSLSLRRRYDFPLPDPEPAFPTALEVLRNRDIAFVGDSNGRLFSVELRSGKSMLLEDGRRYGAISKILAIERSLVVGWRGSPKSGQGWVTLFEVSDGGILHPSWSISASDIYRDGLLTLIVTNSGMEVRAIDISGRSKWAVDISAIHTAGKSIHDVRVIGAALMLALSTDEGLEMHVVSVPELVQQKAAQSDPQAEGATLSGKSLRSRSPR